MGFINCCFVFSISILFPTFSLLFPAFPPRLMYSHSYYLHFYPNSPHSNPYLLHSHPDSPYSHQDSLHSLPVPHIPRIPCIPCIPHIPTQIPRIFTSIPCIPIPILGIAFIPFPDSPFRLLRL